jgi:hypothetical protein
LPQALYQEVLADFLAAADDAAPMTDIMVYVEEIFR